MSQSPRRSRGCLETAEERRIPKLLHLFPLPGLSPTTCTCPPASSFFSTIVQRTGLVKGFLDFIERWRAPFAPAPTPQVTPCRYGQTSKFFRIPPSTPLRAPFPVT